MQKYLVLLFFTAIVAVNAQERSSSPYSYFGLGQQTFDGTIENRSMAGISILADSIHLNLRNPAAYGALRLTTFTVGANHREYVRSTSEREETTDNTNFEYFSVGIPVSQRFAFGFGLLPYKAVGYDFANRGADYFRFTGRGGLNRAYFGVGYQVIDGLNLGVEYRYNFGEEENTSAVKLPNVELGSKELNSTDLGGSTFNFGVIYQTKLKDMDFHASVRYQPETQLNADSERTFSTFALTTDFVEIPTFETEPEIIEETVTLPYDFSVGVGLGKSFNWFLGAEFSQRGSSELTNRSFVPDNTEFTNAYTARLGGYFIPNYNSIRSYFSRIVYRAGIRYGHTGLNLNDEDIMEYGATLGLGLPVRGTSAFSNINLGFEYGRIGTTDAGLIQEDYFGISLGLSLNDKWFRQRKFN